MKVRRDRQKERQIKSELMGTISEVLHKRIALQLETPKIDPELCIQVTRERLINVCDSCVQISYVAHLRPHLVWRKMGEREKSLDCTQAG